VLKLPGNLNAARFLARHWQKEPLFMSRAVPRLRPSVTRNELAWLATQDDVESRIVFTERSGDRVCYRAESGPFDAAFLARLPKRDWTLLVHDVEKHLPAMRRLFALVPFIPDWRIDDLMVSFAAPGGGVGPHRDNYDVFLCQGIGIRDWRISADDIAPDPWASDDLALTKEFEDGQRFAAREGDVLYLPPGVVHWGTASRACLTYSIGMRAPQLSDLAAELPDAEGHNPFYADPDLAADEARPGRISRRATARALQLLDGASDRPDDVAIALGRSATQTKDWLAPQRPDGRDIDAMFACLERGASLPVHGMARIAFDDAHAYVNGHILALPTDGASYVAELCRARRLKVSRETITSDARFLRALLKSGLFEIPGNW
jgi:50S ribosomal protein L16 3-hydroxylase